MSGTWQQWEGQVVDGSFHLQRYLGGSEQSAVFLTQFGDPEARNAAIKLVRADSRDAELISRWERAAQLSHPHLIRLFRIGSWHANQIALHYVVMEYAEEDVARVLTERPLAALEVREMLGPVLDAIAYVHGECLIHGHLKPSNIMAVGEQLKISCDGIRRVGELGGGARKPSVYDPPEFKDGGFSPAGDVWSLGMTLVEALTRRLPTQEGPGQEFIMPETVPAMFLDIVRGCLQVDPQRRATLADIVARLRQPSSEPQSQSPVRPQETSRRRRTVLAVATAGLALTAIVAGPRLLRRPQPSAVIEPSSVQPEPKQQAVKPETGKFAEGINGEKPAFGNTSPSPAPLPKSTPRLSDDSTLGQVAHQVLPKVPQKARDTIRGKVTVSVRARVDGSGKVVSARLDSPGPSRYFAELTLQASRRWQFRPPRVHGQGVSSEWTLRFEFLGTATQVRAVQVSP